jgi:hypothetical protein
MATIFLSTMADRKWLRDVHRVEIRRPQVAVLHGSEDCPEKVEVYKENHINSPYTEWVRNHSNDLVRGQNYPGIPSARA